jgi:hypothetical protein
VAIGNLVALALEDTVSRISLPLAFIATLLALLTHAAPVHAQATRTWVSGVGDDANPCSRTAPCKTFAGAISKTAPGGEIDVLDPGGFGAVTIAKSITIDGGGGQVASVLVAGTNGIVVLAGPNDVVTLRNLHINGIGAGINCIRFLSSAAINIENCEIFGFTVIAINIASNIGGRVFINNCTLTGNSNGIVVDGTVGGAGTVVKATVTETKVANNAGNGITEVSTAGHSIVFMLLDRIMASNNNSVGVQANGPIVGIIIGGSTIAGNVTGVSQVNGGNIGSTRTTTSTKTERTEPPWCRSI